MEEEECLNLVRRFTAQGILGKEEMLANMLKGLVGNGSASCPPECLYEDLQREAAQFGIDSLLVALMVGILYERESIRRQMNKQGGILVILDH